MTGHEGHGGFEEEHDEDDDLFAKQSAMKSLGKHIGADSGDSEEESEEPSNQSDHYDPREGAIPLMTFHRKNKKKGGSGGGMGGMGGGGMDISSMIGSMGAM